MVERCSYGSVGSVGSGGSVGSSGSVGSAVQRLARSWVASRSDFEVRGGQRLVIAHDSKSDLAKFGGQILSRARRAFNASLSVGFDPRSWCASEGW
jgi:hypothetical protein